MTVLEQLIPRKIHERIRPRRRLSLLEFAVAHLYITEGPGAAKEPVRWNPDTFPPQKTILRAIDDKRWTSVVLLTGPQTAGKTKIYEAVMAHAIGEREVSALYVSGNANLAGTQWGKKIKPAFLADPELAGLIPDNTDLAGKREERKFSNGASIHFSGADSFANLSGFTCPVILLDDVQAHPPTIQDHGHPCDVAQTRAASFPKHMRTIVLAGTAGMMEDYLTVKLLASACYLPFVPCPGCGAMQLIEFERFVYDDSSAIEAAADCWMRCAGGCDHQIRFEELPRMLDGLAWVSMPPGQDWISAPAAETGTMVDVTDADVYPNTSRPTDACGFWLNALYWPLGETWADVAAAYVSINGNIDGLRDFYQHKLTRPQRDPEVDEDRVKLETIQALAAPSHLFGTVPAVAKTEPIVLATTIDIQSGYLYCEVRAWHKHTGTSWLVYARTLGEKKKNMDDDERHGRITAALNELYRLDTKGWPIAGDEATLCHSDIFLIDAGYFPDTVYAYVQSRGGLNGKWRAIKGSKLKSKDPKGEIWPRVPERSRHHRRVWFEVHANRAKMIVRELLRIPPGMDGSWNLPSDMPKGTMRAYANHLCSETYDKDKDRWIKESANHWFDTGVYQISAAVALGVRLPALSGVTAAPITAMSIREWMERGKQRRLGR